MPLPIQDLIADVQAIITAIRAHDLGGLISAFGKLLADLGILQMPSFGNPPKAMLATPLMAMPEDTDDECADKLEAAVMELQAADDLKGGVLLNIIVNIVLKLLTKWLGG